MKTLEDDINNHIETLQNKAMSDDAEDIADLKILLQQLDTLKQVLHHDENDARVAEILAILQVSIDYLNE